MLKSTILRSTLTAFACSILMVAHAYAADRTRIEVPAGDLTIALETLQKQSDVELIYQTDQVEDLRTGGVSGNLSPQDALTRLLEGTSLALRTDASGALLIAASRPRSTAMSESNSNGDQRQTDAPKPSATTGWSGPYRLLAQASQAGAPVISAQASQEKPQSGGWQEQPRYLEEVVVTAQKRAQASEDLGLSITVLGAEFLDRQLVAGLDDLSLAVPSLDVFRGNGSHNPTITLRGIGTTNPWVNNSPSVAAHADGFYLPMSAYLNFPIFDMQRIEVLKGPQVGLYGRNSTAGAVNFITARPTSEGTGYVDMSYASYDAVNVTAAVSGPLSANLRGRIAAVTKQGGGYIARHGTARTTGGFSPVPGTIPEVPIFGEQDDYGDQDITAVRGAIEFDYDARFDAFLSLHYSTDQSELVGSTNTNGDRLGRFRPPNDDPYVDYDNFAPFTDAEQLGGVLEMNWYTGNYRITSVTGYESVDRTYGIGDFVPTRVAEANFDEELRSFGQELRIESQATDPMRWLVGASYSADRIDYWRSLVAYDFLRGALGTAYREDDEAVSAFAQAEWRLAPKWLLTGSLRYTDEDKEYDGGSFAINPFGVSRIGLAFPRVVPNGLFGNPRFSDSDLSGKLGLNFEPDSRSLLYATVGRAFKSGGFDGSGITQPSSFEPFGAETVWAYETGAKLRTPGNRLFVAGSVFFYDYTDKQELALVDLGGGINEAIIQNAASSEIYGLDLELNSLVGDALTLSANATFLDSKITDWNSADPAEVAARIGNELPGTPQFMLTVSANWQRRITNSMTFGAALWGTYSDAAYRDIENTKALLSDSYGVVNARIDLISDRGWNIFFFGKNLADREHVTSVRSLVGMLGEYYGPPRSVGIGIRYQPQR